MTQLRDRYDNAVGFVDLYIVFKDPNPSTTWSNDLCKNLMRFFVNQKDIQRIVFPYNFK
jgi:hypothetical protein